MAPASEEPGRRHPVHHISIDKNNRTTIIFLTVCTKNRRPLLANPESHRLLIEWWSKANRWLVGRYIILPDHLHLFCAPRSLPEESLQSWVGYWKNGVARHWSGEKNEPIWQRDFWDRQLRLGENYETQWEYVRHNPIRHNLVTSVEAWPYQGEIHPFEWHDS